MIKKIESFLLMLLFAFVMGAMSALPSHAAQPWATGSATSIFEIGLSTPAATAVLVSAGEGAFGSATLSSSTVGGNCVFFDSNTVSGITSVNQDGTNTAPRIGEIFFITANTPQITPVNAAKRFNNGLVALCSHLARLTIIGSRK